MKLLHGFEDRNAFQGGFVSIGNFDGVHRGHQSIISTLVRQAKLAASPAVVLTFDPHPIRLLKPGQAPPNLSALHQKMQLLEKLGVDCVIAYPTDWDLLQLTPEQFFQKIVQSQLKAKGLVEGPNFFFGHNRAGDIATLQSLCDATGLTLEIVPPVKIGRTLVSSSSVRALIAKGQLSRAVNLLGHPYSVRGCVRAGADRGRSLGFPTANLTDIDTLLPKNGVYAGIGYHHQQLYPAAINVGPNPTFGESDHKLEVHLINFSGDLYDKMLDVDFLDRVRDTVAFEDAGTLRSQIHDDLQTVRALANGWITR